MDSSLSFNKYFDLDKQENIFVDNNFFSLKFYETKYQYKNNITFFIQRWESFIKQLILFGIILISYIHFL